MPFHRAPSYVRPSDAKIEAAAEAIQSRSGGALPWWAVAENHKLRYRRMAESALAAADGVE